jgi:para-nitrobenzyl esterase
LVFGNLTAGQPAVLIGESVAEASRISQRMRRAWTGFAATGDPGWPGFEAGATRLFDVQDSVTDYPERMSREVWQEYPDVLDLL